MVQKNIVDYTSGTSTLTLTQTNTKYCIREDCKTCADIEEIYFENITELQNWCEHNQDNVAVAGFIKKIRDYLF